MRLSFGRKPRALLRYGLYAAVFLCFTLAFAYCSFPWEKVRDVVRSRLEDQLDSDVEIADLSPTLLPGVRLEGVRIATHPASAADQPTRLTIESLTVRPKILPLLAGDLDITYFVEMLGGEIEGGFSGGEDNPTLDVVFEDLDIAGIGNLRDAVGLPLGGKLRGEIHLKVPGGKLARAEGTIVIRGDKLAVGDSRAKLRVPLMSDGIVVETLRLGDLSIEADVRAGSALIKRMSAQSPDLELIGEGRLQPADPFSSTNVNLYVRFKFGTAYRNRSDMTKSLLSLADQIPTLRDSKRPDGFYGFHVWQTLGRSLRYDQSPRPPPGIGGPSASARPGPLGSQGRPGFGGRVPPGLETVPTGGYPSPLAPPPPAIVVPPGQAPPPPTVEIDDEEDE